MSRRNTHPNTPIGKYFYKRGWWRPKWEDAVTEVYEGLHDEEKNFIEKASGVVAVVNANLQAAPDYVFALIQEIYPDVTREGLTQKLNDLNRMLLKIDANVPSDFNGALNKLQTYLSNLGEGTTWAVMTRGVVVVLTTIFLKNDDKTLLQKIFTVLEDVYLTFVKPKVESKLAELK